MTIVDTRTESTTDSLRRPRPSTVRLLRVCAIGLVMWTPRSTLAHAAAPGAPAEDTSIRPFRVHVSDEAIAPTEMPNAGQGQQAQQGTRRTDLRRHDLSVPGREVIQVRVEFDPGYVAPRHTHFGEEIIHVLEGTLECQVEGRPATTYKAGDALLVPTGAVHSVKSIGSGNGAELATYVVEKGSRSSRWLSERRVKSLRPNETVPPCRGIGAPGCRPGTDTQPPGGSHEHHRSPQSSRGE